MKYNISYNVAAAIIFAVIYIYHRLQYKGQSKANAIFRYLLIALFVSSFLDSFTAKTIMYSYRVNVVANYIFNISFFILAAIPGLLLIWYINSYFEGEKEHIIFYSFNRTIYILYCVIVVTTPFSHLIFYFDGEERTYCHGPLYFLIYLMPLYYTLASIIILFVKRKRLSKKYFWSVFTFIFIFETATAVQMVINTYVLFSYFGAAIAMLIMLFAMETPDYRKLIETMEALKEARAEADSANRAKSQFLANMSHEIRTPINGILGLDEIAIEECSDENINKYLYDIQSAGKNLLSIINDILDFSKIESGKMEIVPVEYSLEDIIYNVNNIVSMKAKDKNLSLIIKNDANIPSRLLGDDVRVQQIITNLLNNGIKYTKAGHVALLLKYELLDEKNIYLTIIAKDTGIGIKEEDLGRMFESFNRFDMKKNRNVEGTGLGLALTKQLVELMDGEITVKSTYGVGSEFIAKIKQQVVDASPMGNFDESRHVHIENVVQKLSIPGKKLLVVDDVAMNLKVFEGLVKNTGAFVTSVESGKDCIVMCQAEKYDMIFLDHLMPEMDGVETLEKINSDPESKNKETPVIMLTANAISGVREEYIAAGFTDYLSKPMSRASLFEIIKKYVDQETQEKQDSNIKETKADAEKSGKIKLEQPEIKPEQRSLADSKPENIDIKKETFRETEDEEIKHKTQTEQETLSIEGLTYSELIAAFVKEDKRAVLNEALRDNDLYVYEECLLWVIKLAEAIGNTELTETAKKLERAAVAGNMNRVRDGHEQFIMKYTEVVERLEYVVRAGI